MKALKKISFLLFISIFSTLLGQKYHAYEFAETKLHVFNGQLIVPTRSDLNSSINKGDFQFKFYSNNTCDLVIKGNKTELKYTTKNSELLVQMGNELHVFMIRVNPEIKGEYIIFQYKNPDTDSNLDGESVVVYFCQKLK